jgi:hypothetical protein
MEPVVDLERRTNLSDFDDKISDTTISVSHHVVISDYIMLRASVVSEILSNQAPLP